jgi:dipeptide/tripeptide permease
MSSRRLLLFAALPVLFLLERASYYWVRALLALYLRDPPPGGLGMGTAEWSQALALLSFLTLFAPLLGGVLALAKGPQIPFSIGAFIACVGCAVLANGDAATVPLALALFAAGSGLFKPSLYAIASTELGIKNENARSALFFALTGAASLGAFLAPIGLGFVRTTFSMRGLVHVAAAGFLFISILCGGLVAALFAMRDATRDATRDAMRDKPPPAAPEGPARQGRAHRGVLVLLLLLAPYFIGHALASNEAFTALMGAGSGSNMMFLYGADSIALMLVAAAGFVTLLALSLSSSKAAPTLLILGAGLFLFALGAEVILSLRGGGASLLMVIAGLGLLGAGGALIDPLALSRISAGASPRSSTLLIAAWMVITNGLSTLGSIASSDPAGPGLSLAAGAAFVSGVLLFVLSKRITQAFFPSEPHEKGHRA